MAIRRMGSIDDVNRAITKGGFNSLPKMHFPGGLLIGCDAGTLNSVKIKGNHTAMKSGMVAAETVVAALGQGEAAPRELESYAGNFEASWAYEELYTTRNFSGFMHKFGILFGSAMVWIDQNIFRGKLPFTLNDDKPDYAAMKPAAECKKIDYPKPDNQISFDRLSSVFLSNTNHEEDQPCHLTLIDPDCDFPVDPEQFRSKSRNTPFAGRVLKGRACATMVDGKMIYNTIKG